MKTPKAKKMKTPKAKKMKTPKAKKKKTPKVPEELAKQPSRYVSTVWKLILCWAHDYRPALLTTYYLAGQLIIPRSLKTFINIVFTTSAHKLTQLTCQLVRPPDQCQPPKRPNY